MSEPWLVDLDSTVADTNDEIYRRCREQWPEMPLIPFEQHTKFYFEENYEERWRDKVASLFMVKGFFLNVLPMPGAIAALTEMRARGINACICTAPFEDSEFCVPEKYAWVKRYLGREWVKRMIVTGDKTTARGELLIDDQPKVKGDLPPKWEHILYDQPYNRHITDKRRLTWANWREVLGI